LSKFRWIKQPFAVDGPRLNAYLKFSPFFLFSTMTQPKTGNSLGGRHLSRFVASSTFAAAVLAGGSLLNAGGAHAAQTCTPNVSGIFSISMLETTAGTAPTDTPPCQLNSLGKMATIDAKWVAGQVDTSGSYTYSITSTEKFLEFSLNTNIAFAQLGTATKEIYSDPGFTTLIGTGTSTNGNSVVFTALSDQTLNTVYVKDTYSFNGGTQLNSISNNFKVTPGPLPILGAGASFAFSRKLRRRIKAAA
jgi:hypothetical protein